MGTGWRRRILAATAVFGLVGALGTQSSAAATAGGPGGPVTGTTIQADRFTDVGPDAPFRTEILWLADQGISTGYPDGTFRPFAPVNRDAMAAFLYRMAGKPQWSPPAGSPFTDVPTSHPFYREITWLAARGITTGYPDRTFRPLLTVSREAMAAFLYRFDGKPAWTPPGDSPFTDVPTTAPFFREITWLSDSGITTGYPDGTFRPVSEIQRNAMAAFLHRFAHRADTAAPGPVTGLRVIAAGPTSITLAWTNPTAWDLTAVIVRREPGLEPPTRPDQGAAVALTTPRAELVVDPGLTLDTAYAYSVFTRDATGNTSPAASVTARTSAALNPTAATNVSLGQWFSCARLAGGTVRCWGDNSTGQLGDGTTTDRWSPVTVKGITDAAAVAAGGSSACARLSGGIVRCWGGNVHGQLGDGTTTDRWTPVTVAGITDATAVDVGGGHACAVLAGGTIRCWGANASGQLGDGSTAGSAVPVTVSGISDAVAVAAGGAFSCALVADGSVRCWGSNSTGQLGDGTIGDHPVPAPVSGIAGATGIAAGVDRACAVLTGGGVRCWGNGPLGDGVLTSRWTPVAVSGIATATSADTGDMHACVRLAGGTLRCWGTNGYGPVGDGTSSDRLTPVAVVGVGDATDVATGDRHSCALLAGGSVRCWGFNGFGQLGDGSTIERLAPVSVIGIP